MSIHSLSYVKAHASELLRDVEYNPITITQNGEPTAVLVGAQAYQDTQNTLALLRMIAQGQQDIQAGNTKPLKKAFSDIREQASQ